MKILALETSTKVFSLAVSLDGKILKSRHVRLRKVLSSSIIPGIKVILKQLGLKLKDLDGFAVGLGPGSFTSLRVGLATVKGLALSVQKPVVGIPSLDVLAMSVASIPRRQICTLVDARRNLFYVCFYQHDGRQLRRKSSYQLIGLADMLEQVKEDSVFIGDGIPLCREQLMEKIRDKTESAPWQPFFVEESSWYPQARHLAALAYPQFLKKNFDRADSLVPLYLYPEDCQVQK